MSYINTKHFKQSHDEDVLEPNSLSELHPKLAECLRNSDHPGVMELFAILIADKFECAQNVTSMLELCSERGEINEERLERLCSFARFLKYRSNSAKRLQRSIAPRKKP